jgi:chloramphenicol 3-O-phosphotransferase
MSSEKGKIIILNGVSSSGKTTISRKLQEEMEEHYFWVANDTFCDMSSSKHWKADWVTIINQALTAMIASIKSFSDLGYNVIVDQVFLNTKTQDSILQKCVEALYDYPVLFVRTDCSLKELRRREKERGNRRIGQAESQLNIIHNHNTYDLAIDTSTTSIEDNIKIIKSKMNNNSNHKAFKTLYRKILVTGNVY